MHETTALSKINKKRHSQSVLVKSEASLLVIRSSQQKRLKPSLESFMDHLDFPEPDMPVNDICINSNKGLFVENKIYRIRLYALFSVSGSLFSALCQIYARGCE
ncbi:MAG: hypothetical protein BMS9Abin03_367 [Thermodesulfobacteriota bacterium]|nr:MAG: hypothetical protein BMS9Abin03_367 [Thermodesulfobacteriota bacterium]